MCRCIRLPLKQWRGTLDGVLTSTFLCLREFCRLVVKQKRGNAVLIGSTAAVFGESEPMRIMPRQRRRSHLASRGL